MIINYMGGQFVKISHGDVTLAFNPPSKNSKLVKNPTKFGANVVCQTTNHDDFNGIETVTYGETKPFVVDGAGSYETNGLFIEGFSGKTIYDKKEMINTSYIVSFDEGSVCFLGAINDEGISNGISEKLDSVDIVFIPTGGDFLSPKQAVKFAVSLEPHIIIPLPSDKDSLTAFLKEAGVETEKPKEKVTLKRKDIESSTAEIVVL